jgi:hypothetical protein
VSDWNFEDAQSGLDRRAMVRRLAVGAFAVPAIVAFKLDSLARAGGPSRGHHPGSSEGNGTTYPGSSDGNGTTYPGSSDGNGTTYPGSSHGNGTCAEPTDSKSRGRRRRG